MKATRVAALRPAPVPETILVVDDEDLVLSLVQSVLELAGYRVLTAGSAEEALELCGLHDGRIDLLLTDITMPGMDGIDLAEQVRLRRPATDVLYMTAFSDRLDVVPVRSLLRKPFRPQVLLEKVGELLSRG